MRIALRSRDPSVVHRCWLFVAMSLMQQGSLKKARNIIRFVYEANRDNEDQKLVNMSKGIWSRLKFAYSVRRRS